MMNMLLPIALVILSNCFYNVITKQTPGNVNAFLSLGVTYTVAAAFSFIVFFAGSANTTLSVELKKLNWTSFALGIVIVGLELGYILA
ncbi:MAG: hypothetical protein HUJ73_00405, partial [Eubacterium sp.]|nr:hypothetical protein [Eubacterium sp.]